MSSFRNSVLLTIVAAACFLLPSCGTKEEEAPAKSFTAEGGQPNEPLSATIRIDTDDLTLAESLRLEIETFSGPEWRTEFPDMGGELKVFGIADYGTEGPEATADGRSRTLKWYRLEPYFSGEHLIPELELRFTKETGGGTETQTLRTPQISVNVRPLVGKDREQLKDLHPVKDVQELPALNPWTIAVTVILLAAVVTAAVSGIIHWTGRKQEEEIEPEPPHMVALRLLEQLRRENLAGQGRIEELYVRLSDIVRRYIEEKFGIRAPEQTTEEFLADVSCGSILKQDEASRLEGFLKHCDMVKFAAHDPSGNEIDDSFEAARLFIESTRMPASRKEVQ